VGAAARREHARQLGPGARDVEVVQDARGEQQVDTAVLHVQALGVHDLKPDVLQALLDGTSAQPLHRDGGDVDAEDARRHGRELEGHGAGTAADLEDPLPHSLTAHPVAEPPVRLGEDRVEATRPLPPVRPAFGVEGVVEVTLAVLAGAVRAHQVLLE
jgi:hypothetical protein